MLAQLSLVLAALTPPAPGTRLFASAAACEEHRRAALRRAGAASDWLAAAVPAAVPLAAALAAFECKWAVAPVDAAAALRLLRHGGESEASARASLAAGDTPVFSSPGVVLQLPSAPPLKLYFLSARSARRGATHALASAARRAVDRRAAARRATAAALMAAARRAAGAGKVPPSAEEGEEEEGGEALTKQYLREFGGLSGGVDDESGEQSPEERPAPASMAPLLALSAIGCGIAATVAGAAEAAAACTPPGRRLFATGSLAEPPCLALHCDALRPLLARREPGCLLVGDLGSDWLPAELDDPVS